MLKIFLCNLAKSNMSFLLITTNFAIALLKCGVFIDMWTEILYNKSKMNTCLLRSFAHKREPSFVTFDHKCEI